MFNKPMSDHIWSCVRDSSMKILKRDVESRFTRQAVNVKFKLVISA